MRTTLNISDKLMNELESLASGKSKTQLFTEALEEYINNKRKEKLLSLRGKIKVDYDWQEEERKELLAVREEKGKYRKRSEDFHNRYTLQKDSRRCYNVVLL